MDLNVVESSTLLAIGDSDNLDQVARMQAHPFNPPPTRGITSHGTCWQMVVRNPFIDNPVSHQYPELRRPGAKVKILNRKIIRASFAPEGEGRSATADRRWTLHRLSA